MKRWSTTLLVLVTIVCFTTIHGFAQKVTYLDEHRKPATATNYTYKRVITYEKHLIGPTPGPIFMNGEVVIGTAPLGSDSHLCSLTEYYNTGEPAFVAKVEAFGYDKNCNHWKIVDEAIGYYKSGRIQWKAHYALGKLHGVFVLYNEDGTEKKRAIYENGKLIEAHKFSVPSNSPLVGTWKSAEYSKPFFEGPHRKPFVREIRVATFSQNSIVEVIVQDSYSTKQEKTNWKYSPTSNSTGVLEQYQGDYMVYRGTIKWINRNQFEYTNRVHSNTTMVGQRYTYTRQ
jgi:hypothetical protein